MTPLLRPSHPLRALDHARNQLLEQLDARRVADAADRAASYWRLAEGCAGPNPPTDPLAVEIELKALDVPYAALRHDVELLGMHRDLKRQADEGAASLAANAKAVAEQAEAVDARHRELVAQLANAERERAAVIDAGRRVQAEREQNNVARRQQQAVELQLAERGCPQFAGLHSQLQREADSQEETRLRAHRAMLTEDDLLRAAAHRYGLDQQREVAAPGTWIEGSTPADVAQQQRDRLGGEPLQATEPANEGRVA